MKNEVVIAVIGVVALLGVLMAAGILSLGPKAGGAGAEAGGTTVITDDSATLTIDSFDMAADTETEISSPVITVIDQAGTKLINDAANDSTSCNKGDVLGIWGTGTAYYCEPTSGVSIAKTNERARMECGDGAAEASMSVKIYDEENNVLTADDDAENEADYSVTLGADEVKTLYVKITNNDDNSWYWLGAICTFSGGDIDDFEVTDSNWEEMLMPKEVDDATWSLDNDTATAFTGDWDHCYKPVGSAYLVLEEYDNTGMIQLKVTADSTNPAANTGDNFGLVTLDYSYNVGKDGKIYSGVDDGSDNEDVGNMGTVDEGAELLDPQDLDITASVEGL
jgi:hypothetical protein